MAALPIWVADAMPDWVMTVASSAPVETIRAQDHPFDGSFVKSSSPDYFCWVFARKDGYFVRDLQNMSYLGGGGRSAGGVISYPIRPEELSSERSESVHRVYSPIR